MNFVVFPQDKWNLIMEKLDALPHTRDIFRLMDIASAEGEASFNAGMQDLQAKLNVANEKAAKWDALQEELNGSEV